MASHSMKKTSRKTDFTYEFDGSKESDLIYQGDAYMPTDTTNLRLTNQVEHSYGRVIHRDLVQLWIGAEKAHFETTVKFIVKPRSSNDIPADGLVFFMVRADHTFPSDPDGGNLGIYAPDNPKVFAVEFDIFRNPEWDPDFPHVGINIEARASEAVVQIPKSFIGKEVTLKITYVAATQVISALVTDGIQTDVVSYMCDLSDVLPGEVQVGLAASTGDFVAKQDVAFWDFHSAFD